MLDTAAALHHVEICCKDGAALADFFSKQVGLDLAAVRKGESFQQWLLTSGLSRFIITQRNVTAGQDNPPFLVFCCDSLQSHKVDSVFNVALEVKDVGLRTKAVEEEGGTVLQRPTTVTDQQGTVTYSVVKSCVGNVVHTLLNKSNYTGQFLPGFDMCSVPIKEPWSTHMDHVTFVCRPGESSSIVDWYTKCFGMKRFFTNRLDDPLNGLVIGEDIGMRLMALEYWRCAETGIASPLHDTDDASSPKILRIVLAESLDDFENRHIGAYLREHGGPGIQHVGLHTSNIVSNVKTLVDNGMVFRKPPPTYYSAIGKLEEIQDMGEDLDAFRKLGILIDSEADDFSPGDEKRYLMQIFTFPIFKEETFFLEVIQRVGAKGFGSGNVSALARSVEAYQKSLKL